MNNSDRKLSHLIILTALYLVLGTLAIFTATPKSPIHSKLSPLFVFITLPANLPGFAIGFTEGFNENTSIFIIAVQFIYAVVVIGVEIVIIKMIDSKPSS